MTATGNESSVAGILAALLSGDTEFAVSFISGKGFIVRKQVRRPKERQGPLK